MGLNHERSIKGDDIRKGLWLSESSARSGAKKILGIDNDKRIQIAIPAGSHDGLVIRLRGLGSEPKFRLSHPFLRREVGNMLVRLFVYPDAITPAYGSFDGLGTDDMALEGWVYRKIDEIICKLSKSAFVLDPIKADTIADLFNERGWLGIFDALLHHLKLADLSMTANVSYSDALPGNCQRTIAFHSYAVQGSQLMPIPDASKYAITINAQFIDNPFSVAAILAHELSHVVYYERVQGGHEPVAPSPGSQKPSQWSPADERDRLDVERTVDLLVFMFKIGEFQLRTSRDMGLTLGYFNQRVFERIQVIASRKLGSL